MLDNEKTLEQYFDKVSYICPDKNVYQIFIKDEKINKMNIAKFHVVSSEENIYIFFNECFPIFKVNVGQKIKIKEYHLDITQNYLQLSIIKYNIKEKFMNYYTKKYYGIFFKKVLNRIFMKYKYKNYVIVYLRNLRKKAMIGLQKNMLYKLKKRIALCTFYKKCLLNNLHNALARKENIKANKDKNRNLEKKLYFRLFKNKCSSIIKQKIMNKTKSQCAVKFYNKKQEQKLFIALLSIYNSHNKMGLCADLFHIKKVKQYFIQTLKEKYKKKRELLKRMNKYNKYNYLFIQFLAEELHYNNFLRDIYSEKINQVFNLIKKNYLERNISQQKFMIFIKKYLVYKKRKRFEYAKMTQQFKIKVKFNSMSEFYSLAALTVFNRKIMKNKHLIVKYIRKQLAFQRFFNQISKRMSYKTYKIKANKRWTKTALKFYLFEYFNNLFLAKKQKEIKELKKDEKLKIDDLRCISVNDLKDIKNINVTSSFELKSKKAIQKRKTKKLMNFLSKNVFKNLKTNVQTLKEIKEDKVKYFTLLVKNKKEYYKEFFNSIKTALENKNKKRYLNQRLIEDFIQKTRNQISRKKIEKVIDECYNKQMKNKAFILLNEYSKFKREKSYRDFYFTSKLNQLRIKHGLKEYFKKAEIFPII